MNELDELILGKKDKRRLAKQRNSSKPNELDLLMADRERLAAITRAEAMWQPVAIIYVQHKVTCACCGHEHVVPAVGNNLLIRFRHKRSHTIHEKQDQLKAQYLDLPREMRTFSTSCCACAECFQPLRYKAREETEDATYHD